MILLVDNGSVFTKNITEFLHTIKAAHIIMPFDKVNLNYLEKFDSLILSGRRHNDQAMNALNSKIIQHTISHKKPLLGICYGAEILALTTGGTIRRMKSLQKGPDTVQVMQKNPLCNGVMNVYQSHSFEISSLGESLVHLGRSDACKYEIIQYMDSKIFGTQFHPEMSDDGLLLIEKFVNI